MPDTCPACHRAVLPAEALPRLPLAVRRRVLVCTCAGDYAYVAWLAATQENNDEEKED